MEFGIFYQLPCADDQSPAERYADTISQAQLADQLGFDSVWLAEVHFNPRFSVLPAPLLLGSAIAQTTKQLKIATAVNLMPLHHPVRLAEEFATLDVISRGRAILGTGRGPCCDSTRVTALTWMRGGNGSLRAWIWSWRRGSRTS